MSGITPGTVVGAGLAVAGVPGGSIWGGLIDRVLGGGGESSVLQGVRVRGTLSTAGLVGNVTAYDQLGNSWDVPAAYSWLQSLDLGTLLTGNLNLPASQRDYMVAPVVGRTVNIDFVEPTDQTLQPTLARLAKQWVDGARADQEQVAGLAQSFAGGNVSAVQAPTLTADMQAATIFGGGAGAAAQTNAANAARISSSTATPAAGAELLTPGAIAVALAVAWIIWGRA